MTRSVALILGLFITLTLLVVVDVIAISWLVTGGALLWWAP